VAHGVGNVSSCDSSRNRSASGSDLAPRDASARALRTRRRPWPLRTSLQCDISSRRTRRCWPASMSMARTSASSAHEAAASTSARARHEIRSGPRMTRRSSRR
jgi:hypothetical protein